MTLLRTTWTITHVRPLAEGEVVRPDAGLDPDVILWALDEGEVRVAVEFVE